MNDKLFYIVILQKIGEASPSVAATLIARLLDEDDSQLSILMRWYLVLPLCARSSFLSSSVPS